MAQKDENSERGSTGDILVDVRNLKKYFPVREGILLRATAQNKAVDDVSFTIRAGETLGLVGESGCGKSTLGKCVVRLYDATAGEIFFEGRDIAKLKTRGLKQTRQHIQMIFQDPVESLNSRHTVGEIIEEPLKVQNVGTPEERKARVTRLLETVGLPARSASRYPFEFSGGQRQRIGIARAIALNPKLIVCDEPVSALDVSIQSQILNLMNDLQKELGLSYLFIAHDLAVVKHISDRIAIMYLGRIVEIGDGEEVYEKQRHPYTRALIAAIPVPDPHRRTEMKALEGDVPSPINPPSGCAFHPRCRMAQDICKETRPELREMASQGAMSHRVACHFDF